MEDRACGTNVLAIARSFDLLTSITSRDDLYCKKRLGSLVNVRIVGPCEGSGASWTWVD